MFNFARVSGNFFGKSSQPLGGWELSLSEPGVCQGAGWSNPGLGESGTESGTQHLGSKRLGK